MSPFSPPSQTPTSCPQGQEVTSSSSSVKDEDGDSQFTVEVPSREMYRRDERRRRRESKTRLFSDEGGDSGRETTPC